MMNWSSCSSPPLPPPQESCSKCKVGVSCRCSFVRGGPWPGDLRDFVWCPCVRQINGCISWAASFLSGLRRHCCCCRRPPRSRHPSCACLSVTTSCGPWGRGQGQSISWGQGGGWAGQGDVAPVLYRGPSKCRLSLIFQSRKGTDLEREKKASDCKADSIGSGRAIPIKQVGLWGHVGWGGVVCAFPEQVRLAVPRTGSRLRSGDGSPWPSPPAWQTQEHLSQHHCVAPCKRGCHPLCAQGLCVNVGHVRGCVCCGEGFCCAATGILCLPPGGSREKVPFLPLVLVV